MIWLLVLAVVCAVAMVAWAVLIPTDDVAEPTPNPLTELPSMPDTADPVLVPGLLSGLGLSHPQVPAWISDPDVIASVEAGLIDIPDEFAQARGE